MDSGGIVWMESVLETTHSYRRLIDAAVEQLSDEELLSQPTPSINSVATILRHLGGNLISRWTDFLSSDGEKPDRNRDTEFEPWNRGREELLTYFNQGWRTLLTSLADLKEDDLNGSVMIRGEPHTIPLAITRSMTHIAYHVGQIMIVSRMVHQGEWRWTTIAPGASQAHNDATWGTSASRGAAGGSIDAL